MIQRTRKVGGCNDGTCPRVDETTDPGVLTVQGYRPTATELAAMGVPKGEDVVLVPRSVLDEYAASRR